MHKLSLKWFSVVLCLLLLAGCQQTATSEVTTTFDPSAPGAESLDKRLADFERQRALEIHFIKVGQGDCILVKFPNGRKLLYDCGTSTQTNDAKPTTHLANVTRYLKREIPSRKIDAVVISHAHSDHYNMLPKALAGFSVGELFLSSDVKDYRGTAVGARGFPVYEWIETVFEDYYEVKVFSGNDLPNLSDTIDFGRVKVQVLAAHVTGGDTNAESIVLRIDYGDFEAILTGDATKHTESNILSRFGGANALLDIEVLHAGHHGSHTSTSSAWAKATKPEAAVISTSYQGGYGHPRLKVIRNLEGKNISEWSGVNRAPEHRMTWYDKSEGEYRETRKYRRMIYSTATNGSIVVTSDGKLDGVGGFDIDYK